MPIHIPESIRDILEADNDAVLKVQQILDLDESKEIKAAAFAAEVTNDKFRSVPMSLLDCFLGDWIEHRATSTDNVSLLQRILPLINKRVIHSDEIAGQLFGMLNQHMAELSKQGLKPVLAFLEWADEVPHSCVSEILSAIKLADARYYGSMGNRGNTELKGKVFQLLRQKGLLSPDLGFWDQNPLNRWEFVKWYKFYHGDRYLNNEKVQEAREISDYQSIKNALKEKAVSDPQLETLMFLVDTYSDIKKQDEEGKRSRRPSGGSSKGYQALSNSQKAKAEAKDVVRYELSRAFNAIFTSKNDFQLDQRIGGLVKTLYELSQGARKGIWLEARKGVFSRRLKETLDSLLKRFNAAESIRKVNGLIRPAADQCVQALLFAAMVMPIDKFQDFVKKHLKRDTFGRGLWSLTASELQILLCKSMFFTDVALADSFVKLLSSSIKPQSTSASEFIYIGAGDPQIDYLRIVATVLVGVNRYMTVLSAEQGAANDILHRHSPSNKEHAQANLDSVLNQLKLVSQFQSRLKEMLVQAESSGSDLRDNKNLRLLLKDISDAATVGGYMVQWSRNAKLDRVLGDLNSRFPLDSSADVTVAVANAAAAVGGGAAAADEPLAAVDVFNMLSDKFGSNFRRYLSDLKTEAAREAFFNMTDPDTGYSLLAYILINQDRSRLFLRQVLQILMTLKPEKVMAILQEETGPVGAKITPLNQPGMLEKLNAQQVLIYATQVLPGLQLQFAAGETQLSNAIDRLLRCLHDLMAAADESSRQMIDLVVVIHDITRLPGLDSHAQFKHLIDLLSGHFNFENKARSLRSPREIRLALLSTFVYEGLNQDRREKLLHQLRANMGVITFTDGWEERLSFDYQLAEIGVELRALLVDCGRLSPVSGVNAKKNACQTLLRDLITYAFVGTGNASVILKTLLHIFPYRSDWAAIKRSSGARLYQQFDKLNTLVPDISDEQKQDAVCYLLGDESDEFTMPRFNQLFPGGLDTVPIYLYALEELPGLTDYWFDQEVHVRFLKKMIFGLNQSGDMDHYIPIILQRLSVAEAQSQMDFLLPDDTAVATMWDGVFDGLQLRSITVDLCPFGNERVRNWLSKNMHLMHIDFVKKMAGIVVTHATAVVGFIEMYFYGVLSMGASHKDASVEVKQLACLAEAAIELERLRGAYLMSHKTGIKKAVSDELHSTIKQIFPGSGVAVNYDQLLAELVVYITVLRFSARGVAAEEGNDSNLQQILHSLRQSFPLRLDMPFVRKILLKEISGITREKSQFDHNLALLKTAIETDDQELMGKILQKEGVFSAMGDMIGHQSKGFCQLVRSLQKYHHIIFRQSFDGGKTLLFVAALKGTKGMVNEVVSAILQLEPECRDEILIRKIGGKRLFRLANVRNSLLQRDEGPAIIANIKQSLADASRSSPRSGVSHVSAFNSSAHRGGGGADAGPDSDSDSSSDRSLGEWDDSGVPLRRGSKPASPGRA